MPQSRCLTLCLLACSLISSGCQCWPGANRYSNLIDGLNNCSKTKLEWAYHPGVDISRAGMPDWCRCGLNRRLCRCKCDKTRCHHGPIQYPAEHTVKYWAMLAEAESAPAPTPVSEGELPVELELPEPMEEKSDSELPPAPSEAPIPSANN